MFIFFAPIRIDAVRAPEELPAVITSLGANQTLSIGVVNGRNIWLTNFAATQHLIEQAVKALGSGRVIVSPSCSLLHTPHHLNAENKLDPRIKSWLRFSAEKLSELVILASTDAQAARTNAATVADRESAESSTNKSVRERLAALAEKDFDRASPYPKRAEVQRAKLNLPLPTTTIGLFPQTTEARQKRAAFKHGLIDRQQYEDFLRKATEECIYEQERIGLNVLVHGEFERNDMVEYFAEFLQGFAFTENGWVQSYGSRCVKPPVIYGDVWRTKPMTVDWSSYTRSLTKKPMKGMPDALLPRDSMVRRKQTEQLRSRLPTWMRSSVRSRSGPPINPIKIELLTAGPPKSASDGLAPTEVKPVANG